MSSPSSIAVSKDLPPLPSPTLTSSDVSIELSFTYDNNAEGEVVRISKGSGKSEPSTPSSPSDSIKSSPSPVLPSGRSLSAPRRSSLSRSESMPSEPQLSARPLQRTVSGPVATVTPALPSRSLGSLSSGLGTGRRLGRPQRIPIQEAERQRREAAERMQREETERDRLRREIEKEKENKAEPRTRYSPPGQSRVIAALPTRQTAPSVNRSIKPLMPTKLKPGYAKVIKLEGEESEHEDHHGILAPLALTNQRHHLQSQPQPNRSHAASPVDVLPDIKIEQVEYINNNPNPNPQPQLRYSSLPPSRASSTVASVSRARRITLEEKLRQDQELIQDTLERVKEEEITDDDRYHLTDIEHRPSPSPTHVVPRILTAAANSRPGYTHKRRDSDTLRNGLPTPTVTIPLDGRESVENLPLRSSPPSRNSASTVLQSSRHRRSPTAPEHPSITLVSQTSKESRSGKTWAPGENEVEREREKAIEEFNDIPKPISAPPAAQQPQALSAPVPDPKSRNLVVNKKFYARLDLIGKGGSSRVYRVMNNANEIYALKRVSLDKTDTESLRGYMNEISLLKRLAGNNRIIRLIDSEAKSGVGGSGGHLMLVMECGEVDLAKLLQEQQKEPLNMVWISYYWQQILQAVQVIHDEKIVHSDLKPANFVLVKGQLKLIDFGIANAIANDTTNIQRDHQIGTLNYMSPEAIELPEGMRRLKVGRPSDVWSLGCILYQMVYGSPPFQQLSVFQKMKAIPDSSYAIEYPDLSVPTVPARRDSVGASPPPEKLTALAKPVRQDVKVTMQKCLQRNPKDRSTIPELLEEDWLAGKEPFKLKDDETVINAHYMKQLLQYAIKCARDGGGVKTDAAQDAEARRLVQELKSISTLNASKS